MPWLKNLKFYVTIGEASVFSLKTFTTPKYVLMTCLFVGFSLLKHLSRQPGGSYINRMPNK